MRTYAGEKSVGLGPIVLALSVVTIAGFGVLYAMFGHEHATAGTQDLSAPESMQMQSQNTTALPMGARSHSHV